jgi:hypothetical protein
VLHIAFILILAAHLVAMNVATAAPLVCLWLKRREVRNADAEAGLMGQFLAWQSVTSLLIGTFLGLLAAGILWLDGDRRFFDALAIVPRRRLWFGVVELLFFLVLMAWYARAWPRAAGPTLWHPALAVLAATDLIYHFPPLFAVLTVLQGRSTLPAEELSYAEFVSLLAAPEALARVAHFLLASIAVTGAIMLLHAMRRSRDFHVRWIAWSGRLALAPSLLQLVAGIGVLLTLPVGQQQRMMGGDPLATGLFGGSVIAVFGLLHHLASVALGETERRAVLRSLGLMVLVILTMTALRHGG